MSERERATKQAGPTARSSRRETDALRATPATAGSTLRRDMLSSRAVRKKRKIVSLDRRWWHACSVSRSARLISAWLGLSDAEDHCQQFTKRQSGFHVIGHEQSGFEKKWHLSGTDKFEGTFTSTPTQNLTSRKLRVQPAAKVFCRKKNECKVTSYITAIMVAVARKGRNIKAPHDDLTRVTKSYRLALGTTQISSYSKKKKLHTPPSLFLLLL